MSVRFLDDGAISLTEKRLDHIPTVYLQCRFRQISLLNTEGLYDNATYVVSENEAATFIQVHPTFLYESMWNLVLLLLIIFFFTKRKKFDGELIAIYCIGYGIGRFLIEGLRTDSLMIGSTGIRVSQILALILAVFGTAFILYKRKKITK